MTLVIAAIAIAGVIIRPFNMSEAVWAGSGAALLVLLQLITPQDALAGIGKGMDVYLFLTGMMVLSETAREAGLFDWIAAVATRQAKGSASTLFLLIYGVGTIVTIFLSNDATAVVLTPAVAAAVRTATIKKPLPYLLICAFVANAASFVLPISNPANLVIYGSHMPPLLQWLPRYILPSLVSIGVTLIALRWTQRALLHDSIAKEVPVMALSRGGKTAAFGIAATAIVLLASSMLGISLGLPTAAAGILTASIVLVQKRSAPWRMIASISWGVLPLVAGLFVLVEGLERSGLIRILGMLLHDEAVRSVTATAWAAGTVVAFVCNVINNLPAGLIAGSAIQSADLPDHIIRAMLIGVDLGPNLSVTGSLATILWLTALRREGQRVDAVTFLKLGVVVMPPALALSIAALFALT